MNAIEQMVDQTLNEVVSERFFTALMIEFGGAGKAAQAIGVRYQTVRQWKKRGVPLSRIKQIEELSEGRVHRGLL